MDQQIPAPSPWWEGSRFCISSRDSICEGKSSSGSDDPWTGQASEIVDKIGIRILHLKITCLPEDKREHWKISLPRPSLATAGEKVDPTDPDQSKTEGIAVVSPGFNSL
jgi:hypothetical protein